MARSWEGGRITEKPADVNVMASLVNARIAM